MMIRSPLQALDFLRDAIRITQGENNKNKLETLYFQQANHYKDLKRYNDALQVQTFGTHFECNII